MRKAGVAALFLALISSPGVFAAGSAEAGKAIYMKRCTTCHADDGNGKEAIAKMMQVTIAPLPSKEVQTLSDDEIGKVITAGKGKMKPVTGLSPADIADVIAFVRSLKK